MSDVGDRDRSVTDWSRTSSEASLGECVRLRLSDFRGEGEGERRECLCERSLLRGRLCRRVCRSSLSSLGLCLRGDALRLRRRRRVVSSSSSAILGFVRDEPSSFLSLLGERERFLRLFRYLS